MSYRNQMDIGCTRIIASVALAMLAGCGGDGESSLASTTFVETEVLVQDIDGDGRADILTLGYALGNGQWTGQLSVYRQVGSGQFTDPDVYAVGCGPLSMTLSDVDGDGRLDLVIADPGSGCADPSSANAVHLMLQDRVQPSRFLPARRVVVGTNAYQAAVADFNGDGLPDIAAGGASPNTGTIMVALQDPALRGTFFQPTFVPVPYSPSHITAADLNEDGRADLFVNLYLSASGTVWNSALSVMLQQPGGGFGTPQQLSQQSGLNVSHLTITDVDRDGKIDLIAHLTPSSTDSQPRLTAVLQRPSGSGWSTAQDTALQPIDNAGGATDHSAIGDLNGDGQPDLAIVGTYAYGGGLVPKFGSTLNLLRHAGAGTYVPMDSYAMPFLARTVGLGDIDGDGRNDIVVFGEGVVMLLLQSHSTSGTFEAPRSIR